MPELQKIKFIADSACDLKPDYVQKYGLDIVPLHVRFGDDHYLDSVTIDSKKFYELLEKCDELPKTSQANPDQFEEVISKYADDFDEVIVFTLASGLSGSYQSACAAKEHLGRENVYVVDTETGSIAELILIDRADKLRRAGKSAAEIVGELNALKKHIVVFAALDSLKYLQKGGRISGTKATIGAMLNLKAIVKIYGGVVTSEAVVRGQKRAITHLAELVSKLGRNAEYPLTMIFDAGSALRAQFTEELGKHTSLASAEVFTGEFGAVVGSYAGPHSVGLAWVTP